MSMSGHVCQMKPLNTEKTDDMTRISYVESALMSKRPPREHPHPGWDLVMSCKGKFKRGDKVRTRGDFGSFNLIIVTVHNEHFATCRGYGKDRHLNMNVLEHR